MGTQITNTGIKFPAHDKEQTAPVVSVNSTAPDSDGNIEVAAGGGATYTSQDYHATTDFLFKDSKWYGEHMVYSYSTNASAIENLSVGSVLHEVGSDLSFSVVFIDAAANRITLNRGDFVDLGTSNKTLEDRENSTFGGTTFTYVSGTGNSMNCTNIWLQVIGNQNNANTESLPNSNNSVANLPMKLDHLPSMATHIIFRVSSETGGSFKIYNRETFNVRPPTAELLPSEIVHQIDIEGSGTQSGFSEFRVPVNSYFRFWVTGGAKANLYPVGYSVLDLSEIDLQSASNPVITALETRVNTLEGSSGVTTVNGQTGDVTVSGFDGDYNSLDNKPTIPADHSSDITNLGNRILDLEFSTFDGDYNSLDNKPTIPTDLNDLSDDDGLLSSGGGAENPNITSVQYQNGPEIAFLADGAMYMAGTSSNSYWSDAKYVTNFFNSNETYENARKVPIPDSSPIKQMGVFSASAFALTESGNLYSWGRNSQGQLGLGHNTDVLFPTLSATGVVKVFPPIGNAGNNISVNNEYDRLFYMTISRRIYGTGYNGRGALGLGHTNNVNTWTEITSLYTGQTSYQVDRIYNIGGYSGFTISYNLSGNIKVAGANGSGQLGVGDTNDRSSFTSAGGWRDNYDTGKYRHLKHVKVVRGSYTPSHPSGENSSQWHTTCYMVWSDHPANETNSIINASGYNKRYNITSNITSMPDNTDVDYPYICWSGAPVTEFYTLSDWSQGVMFRTSDNKLYAWGKCLRGQFGTGNQTETFADVTLLRSDVSQLFQPCFSPYSDSGISTVYIKLTNGKIYSAGWSGHYQLGRHDMTTGAFDFGEVAFPDEGFEGIKYIFSASSTATGVTIFAVTNNNRIFGWGYNGQQNLFYPNYGNIKYPFLLDMKIK